MTTLSAPMTRSNPVIPSQPVRAVVARSRRDTVAAIASLVVLTFLTSRPGFGPWCRLTPDSFTYLDAARCLRETGGYSPFRMIAPPGFSTLLAPLLVFGDLPLWAVRFFNLTCWSVTSVLTFLLFRRSLGNFGAWLAAALTATSPALATQSTALLSEPAFTPIVLTCLLLAERRTNRPTSKWLLPIALGLLCAAATFVRTMGIVLAPILAFVLLIKAGAPLSRRAASAILFILTLAIPLGAWEVRQSGFPSNNSYGRAWLSPRPWESTESTGLALQAERLAHYGPTRLRDIKSAIVPPRLGWRALQGPMASTATWIIGGGIVFLNLRQCWRNRRASDFFVLATLAMLCVWPYDEGTRLVTPLLPIFFAYGVGFMQEAVHALERRPMLAKSASIVIPLLIVAQFCELGLSRPALADQRNKAYQRLASMQHIRDWQEKNLPSAATTTCIVQPHKEVKTLLVGGSYLSRRRIVQFVDCETPSTEDLASIETSYCFVQSQVATNANMPGDWKPVGAVEGFDVFSRDVPISASPPPATAHAGG